MAISMAEAGDTAGALAVAEKLEGENRAALRFIITFSLCTTEVEGTKGADEVYRKMKPSIAPEDKPLVRKLFELLPE